MKHNTQLEKFEGKRLDTQNPDLFQGLEGSYEVRVKLFDSNGSSNPCGGSSLQEYMLPFIEFERLSLLIRIIFRLSRNLKPFPNDPNPHRCLVAHLWSQQGLSTHFIPAQRESTFLVVQHLIRCHPHARMVLHISSEI